MLEDSHSHLQVAEWEGLWHEQDLNSQQPLLWRQPPTPSTPGQVKQSMYFFQKGIQKLCDVPI